jgi:hypothetical protein
MHFTPPKFIRSTFSHPSLPFVKSAMRTPNVPSPTYQLGGWKYILDTINPLPTRKKGSKQLSRTKEFHSYTCIISLSPHTLTDLHTCQLEALKRYVHKITIHISQPTHSPLLTLEELVLKFATHICLLGNSSPLACY